MPRKHPHVKVTEDPQLAEALRAAAPYLRPGMSISQQIRELALIGAASLPKAPPDDQEARRRLDELADMFQNPETAFWDWDALREMVDARHFR
jgi:hypothetical protein